jgi:hypothetical protein
MQAATSRKGSPHPTIWS